MTTRIWPLLLLAPLAATPACFSYEDTAPTDASAGTDSEDATLADDAGDDPAEDPDAGGGDDAAPDLPGLPEVPACESVTELEQLVEPMGCDYTVEHPRGIVDILPSCGTAGVAATPTALHLTFPSESPSRDIAVTWTTGDDTRLSEVELGESLDALTQGFRGHSFTYRGLEGRLVHEVHLCGLEPGRTYYYRVGGEGAWSDVFNFTTAPEYGSTERFTFAVTGDTRHDTNEPWAEAVRAMHEAGAEFLLFSGDAVDTGGSQAQWDSWFSAGAPYMAEIPYVPAVGNHDLLTINYSAQFALPHIEDNYFVRYGNALIISLNDFPIHDPAAIAGSTAEFLEQTLRDHTDATWRIVLNHRPFYSASTRHGSSLDLQAEWMPIMDRYGVDLVFNGHDHNYERSRPVRNGAVVPFGEGAIYVVAAGVGAPLYDNGSQWWTQLSERVPSYCIVEVEGGRLEFTAYRLDGTVIDTFTWEK
jgi:hypothetical protein